MEELILVKESKMKVTIDGKEFKIDPGDIYFVNSDLFHGVRNASEVPCSYFIFKWK